MQDKTKIGVIIIGRNEGQRLLKCLQSFSHTGYTVVYVDSNSSDDSVLNANKSGADVVDLDMTKPFSAARARNEGWKRLLKINPQIEFIQFVDADCEIHPSWIPAACNYLLENNEYAIVSGRLKERHPDATLYNRFCHDEWNTPVGEAVACGGNAFIRVKSLIQVDGYNTKFVAGEEPEMCFRLRQQKWKIYRIDHDMGLHDANITRFSQWWKRAKRSGLASALSVEEHGSSKERYGVRRLIRPLFWSSLLLITLILGAIYPVILTALLIFPIQILRMFIRMNEKSIYALQHCTFTMLSKLPEALGILGFVFKKITNNNHTLIEYK